MSLHWTGQPFVDAGLAALLACTRVHRLDNLTAEDLEEACQELEDMLLSDQTLGIGLEKSFAKSTLSQVFPNSELVNPSNWGKGAEGIREKYRAALRADLERAKRAIAGAPPERVCLVCGAARPANSFVALRRDHFPLLSGAVNFYPGLSYGVELCGICRLALRFVPLSVLRAGDRGRLWFLHCPAEAVARRIAQRFGREHFKRLISAGEGVDFYGDWRTAGNGGVVLRLLCRLLHDFGTELRTVYQRGVPAVAYVFSNDNRGGYIEGVPVPTAVLDFLQSLYLESPNAFKQFEQELLAVEPGLAKNEAQQRERFVAHVAGRIIRAEPIIGLCRIPLPDGSSRLFGGWIAHRIYLQEVIGMNEAVLALLERTGIALAQHERAKQLVGRLERARPADIRAVFLDMVREGLLTAKELAALLPPNEPAHAQLVRDVTLGIVYEWQRAQEAGEPFPQLPPAIRQLTPDETIERIANIAERLVASLPNRTRWIVDLMATRRTAQMRATYLRALRSGALGLDDFLFLVPLGQPGQAWVLRDYLLAFLFEYDREAVPEDVEIAEGEETGNGTEVTIAEPMEA